VAKPLTGEEIEGPIMRPVLYPAFAAFLLLAGSARAQDEMAGSYKLVPALPRPGATQIFDNARGRVWDVIYPPGMSTGMHRHPSDFVGVELVETLLKVTTPDGKEHVGPIRRGQIYMLPKGTTHIEENVVGHPQRNSILIELKDGGPALYDNHSAAPAGFAAAGAQQVADNARVILWDARWTAGAPAKRFFQSHDMFIVPIDAGTLSITSPDDATQTLPLAGGQVVFLQGGHVRDIHATEGNVRAAVIELK
jgi:uncharacterized protein YjlB